MDARLDSEDIDLISRIYDTALDPSIWPDLMLRIAQRLGAKGAFIFELHLDVDTPMITSRVFSSNYDPQVVKYYISKFNGQEIIDQGRFAELSQKTNDVELISDISLRSKLTDLLAQPNTAFLIEHGLKHRAGALLNKDLINVDRFALQFDMDHGPIRPEEIRKAGIFLPHIAKVIGLSRPLEEQMLAKGIFEEILRGVRQGVAVLGPRGNILYANNEFERCLSDYGILRKTSNETLQLVDRGNNNPQAKLYHDLVVRDDAHGLFGARARREAIVIELEKPGTALFIEICPVEASERTGKLGRGCRLVTVIDTSKDVNFDIARLKSFYHLSTAETEILELVAKGHTNAEISELRHRSADTVKSQIKTLMRKTNSQNRTDLVHMIHHMSAAIDYRA